VIQQKRGVSGESVGRWVRDYRRFGEAGLSTHRNGKGRRLPAPVRQKIVEIKKTNPLFGITRISQLLKRAFFLSASPETVRKTLRKTLRDSSLASVPPRKRQRNITRPRFIERSTPNQLWQTDIFTFRLGGHYASLIGHIDYLLYHRARSFPKSGGSQCHRGVPPGRIRVQPAEGDADGQRAAVHELAREQYTSGMMLPRCT